MKKKLFSLLPAFALIASFSLLYSCSGTAQQSTPAPAETVSAQPAPAKTPAYQDVDAAAFKKLMQDNPGAVVLDVRTPAEVAEGTIQGAVNIDVKALDFQDKINALDKDKTYLVYCRSGRRSSAACQMMQNAGFKSLYNLQGGILAWQAAQ
ncbi:MAG: rhodanese-like domain-containing protein [Lewinellaceae bacterium]|nr:rhodanese-like domain-containing protein [Lewinellaceae bacterium]